MTRAYLPCDKEDNGSTCRVIKETTPAGPPVRRQARRESTYTFPRTANEEHFVPRGHILPLMTEVPGIAINLERGPRKGGVTR